MCKNILKTIIGILIALLIINIAYERYSEAIQVIMLLGVDFTVLVVVNALEGKEKEIEEFEELDQ